MRRARKISRSQKKRIHRYAIAIAIAYLRVPADLPKESPARTPIVVEAGVCGVHLMDRHLRRPEPPDSVWYVPARDGAGAPRENDVQRKV